MHRYGFKIDDPADKLKLLRPFVDLIDTNGTEEEITTCLDSIDM